MKHGFLVIAHSYLDHLGRGSHTLSGHARRGTRPPGVGSVTCRHTSAPGSTARPDAETKELVSPQSEPRERCRRSQLGDLRPHLKRN